MASRKADMFTDPETDPRPEPPPRAGERDTLAGFLTWQRETLRLKCSDLTPDQLAARPIEPSTLSLIGLVRHLADVERGWFRVFMDGQTAPPHYRSAESPDGEFEDVRPTAEIVDEAWKTWEYEVDFANRYIAATDDLDRVGSVVDTWRGEMSFRWVLVHMIEEYARHLGHADLLRERLDGRIGQ